MDYSKARKAHLILEDGTVFEGNTFGSEGTIIGEVVFTTSMTGYQETLTDPSYYGQIIVQTFPLIGNYGVNDEDCESEKSVAGGYIVREHCAEPSNFRCSGNIDEFLKKQGIIGLYGIDTRRLTRIIREKGVMNGMITCEDFNLDDVLVKIRAHEIKSCIEKVSVKERKEYFSNGKYKVVMIDYGHKRNLLNELIKIGCDVTVVPYNSTDKDVLSQNPDGIVLSSGPGDPSENTEAIQTIKELMKSDIPIFGVCKGHQLAALANGAKTEKLKYGHRGANQPVVDLKLGKTFITSQNHGYTVVPESVTSGEISHINANDKTCEGICYNNAPVFTVQFYPESHNVANDTAYLFEKFLKLMEKKAL